MTVQVEAFLDLEESLIREILPRWNKIQKRIDPQIVKALEEGNLSKVTSILDTITPEQIYGGKINKIAVLLKTGVAFGGTLATFGNVEDVTITSEPLTDEIVPIATEQFKTMIGQLVATVRSRYMSTAVKSLDRLNWEAQQSEVLSKGAVALQKVNPINLPSVVGKTGSTFGAGGVTAASSLQMSRMSQYGFVNQAMANGVTQYRVNEQLDSRTCPVCRVMNGKVFDVAPATAKLDTQIRITDPQDLKLLAPFPKKGAANIKELKTFTAEQLRAKGFDTPPYHPRCRGLLQRIPEAPRTPTALDDLQPLRQIPDKPFTSAADYYAAGDIAVTEEGIIASLAAEDAAAIRAFEKRLEDVIPTKDRFFNKDTGKWTAERAKVHEEVIDKVIRGFSEETGKLTGKNIGKNGVHRATVKSGERKKYVLFGGRGGSGKSWLSSAKGPIDGDDFLVLDSDAIKGLLPEYKGWNAFEVHEESSYLFDEITRVAQKMNLNIVHDMTLKSAKSAVKRVDAFTKAGYEVEGYYMYLPRHEAANRAVARSLGKTQRYVPLDIILSNTENEAIFDSLKERFVRWGMWDNNVPKGTQPKVVGTSY
jgi:predicted ABC-type ATPase